MNHSTLPCFWREYNQLPSKIQQLADKNYALLRDDPFHPSLHFKKVGKKKHLGRFVLARVIAHWAWTKAKALFGFG
jgi:hypothetical protein